MARPQIVKSFGRTERGFDFLGYHFELFGLSVADKTIERFKERIARLYEQGADIHRIGQYVLKWLQWTRSGIHELHNINILAAPKMIKLSIIAATHRPHIGDAVRENWERESVPDFQGPSGTFHNVCGY